MRITNKKEALVCYEDLQSLFLISRRTAERLVSEGVFEARPYHYDRKKWFDLEQCVQSYVQHMKPKRKSNGGKQR